MLGPLGAAMGTKLSVEGMACEGCERTVEEALADVPGVDDVAADAESGTVSVDGDADETSLREAVSGTGFDVAA